MCCSEDDVSEDCTRSKLNVCSDTFASASYRFYSYCPKEVTCMSSDPLVSIQKPLNEASEISLACTYQFEASTDLFKSGSIVLRFNEITQSDVYLYSGKSIDKSEELKVNPE